jgi:fatty-acyl-CoA synthase
MSRLTDHMRALAHNQRPGLLFEDDAYSHAEIYREASARASLLRSMGPGDPAHIGVLLENIPESLFWLEGALLDGVTVVGLNATRRGPELLRDISHTDCQLVVTDPAGEGILQDAGLERPTLIVGTDEYDRLLSSYRGDPAPEIEVPEEARAILIFTSGTTSAPKAAIRSHGALVRISEGVISSWGITDADVAYNAMPWFHSNALYHAILPVIVSGGTVAFRRRFSARGFIGDVQKFHATRFNYVGKVLEYVLATPERDTDRDNDLRIVTGSEASERDIAAFGQRFDVYVMDGFGSTEGGVGILRTPDMPSGSLGLPTDENTVVMDRSTLQECPRARFDAAGRLLNADECIGEFVNKTGLASFEGYYKNEEGNRERSYQGWFWSGDLGYRDEKGYFYFAGRGYDWLRVDGENFSAAPVERLLVRHPDVLLAAVYAVPDANSGDQVMAALQLRAGATFDPREFEQFLDQQGDLGSKWRPKFVRVAAELPISHTNKIKKAQLRDEAWLVSDPVWWRPGRPTAYVAFGAGDEARLRKEFDEAGRLASYPRGRNGPVDGEMGAQVPPG